MMDSNTALVLFKGGVETQEFFSYELARTFDELGYIIYFYNLLTDAESFAGLQAFVKDARQSDRRVVAFSFNFNGLAGEEFLYGDDGSIYWDLEDIPCFNMVLDHPFYYHRYIERLPQKYYQISIDRNHDRYMRRFFPKINLCGYLALAGTRFDKDEPLMAISQRPNR